MKPCNDQCKPTCDFCRMFNFNPGKEGEYRDLGYCVLKEEPRDPLDECDEFVCANYKVKSI